MELNKIINTQNRAMTWSLLLMMPLIGMCIDLVAPSLPNIAQSLQISNHAAKNIISVFLFGYALGNFFIGFLTDAWGRKTLLRTHLLGFVLVSLIPIFLPKITFLLLARFLQGFTTGAIAVLIRAIFSDILTSGQLIRLGTIMGTMWGIGPVIGPLFGGYLQYYFGWKACFGVFALLGSLGCIAIFLTVDETHKALHPLQLKIIKNNLIQLLRHRLYLGIIFLMGLAYSLIVIFNTLAPFLIQTRWHYSPVFFGQLALGLGFTFLAATFVCRTLLKTKGIKAIYWFVINSAFLSASVLLICSFFFKDSMLLLLLASGIMFFSCGFIFPMSMGKGLSLFQPIAGAAAAVMYLINILITSVASLIVSFINVTHFTELMAVYWLLLLGCFLIYWRVIRSVNTALHSKI